VIYLCISPLSYSKNMVPVLAGFGKSKFSTDLITMTPVIALGNQLKRWQAAEDIAYWEWQKMAKSSISDKIFDETCISRQKKNDIFDGIIFWSVFMVKAILQKCSLRLQLLVPGCYWKQTEVIFTIWLSRLLSNRRHLSPQCSQAFVINVNNQIKLNHWYIPYVLAYKPSRI